MPVRKCKRRNPGTGRLPESGRQSKSSPGANGSTSYRKILQPGTSLGDDRVCDKRSLFRRRSGGRGSTSCLLTQSQEDEGVLYTVKVMQLPHKSASRLVWLRRKLFGRGRRDKDGVDREKRCANPPASSNSVEGEDGGEEFAPPPLAQQLSQQFTVTKKYRRWENGWLGRLLNSFGLCGAENVDSYLYRPSRPMLNYITWSFYASFTSVFISFFMVFIVLCFVFAGLLVWAASVQPECIIVSGDHYGTNPDTKFMDAFVLSWTTFSTVGYGNVYTTTGNDYVEAEDAQCAGVVFLCTLEAFTGLIYAGMCAAILFGKVNRIQCHAHVTFANAVCLQYEDVEEDHLVDAESSDSDCERDNDVKDGEDGDADDKAKAFRSVNFALPAEGNKVKVLKTQNAASSLHYFAQKHVKFRERFRGCPILKFQVVNDLCNKAGGEIIDGFMKVVGMKLKLQEGRISHSQYVRVSLVECEHPFFGRLWHGVHILDGNSPLLTQSARRIIRENRGRWPEEWFKCPSKIRRKLDFQHLVVTVSGTSNLSASNVHAYKRYKFEDVIIGFDFAPVVYEKEGSGKLKVDLGLANDVREQHKGRGEDLQAGATVVEAKKKMEGEFGSITRGTSSVFRKSSSIAY